MNSEPRPPAVCVVAHVTRDILRTPYGEKMMPGGVAVYFSVAFQSLGGEVDLVTRLAPEDGDLLQDLGASGVRIHRRESPVTTCFENRYDKDLRTRSQSVRAIAAPFTPADLLPDLFPFFHLGPLTRGDISLDLIRTLADQGSVSLDAQGMVREVMAGRVREVPWKEMEKGLPFLAVLKADETEARILSGEEDLDHAASRLAGLGVREVVLTEGEKGSRIFADGRIHKIPAFPVRPMDVTGAGDTYMAGYLFQRMSGRGIFEAGTYAAAAASLKIAAYGPFRGIAADVSRFLARCGFPHSPRP